MDTMFTGVKTKPSKCSVVYEQSKNQSEGIQDSMLGGVRLMSEGFTGEAAFEMSFSVKQFSTV